MDSVDGTIVDGHGVAGGRAMDPRFPRGTIHMQKPFFLAQGVDLSRYHDGTLNVDLAPMEPPMPNSDCIVFQGLIRWREDTEEMFTLSEVQVEADGNRYSGLWYFPHPQTKPEHFQPKTVVELLLPWTEGLTTGKRVKLVFAP